MLIECGLPGVAAVRWEEQLTEDKHHKGVRDFGDDLLVAPVLQEGNTRRIYLPEGAWLCLYTGISDSTGGNGVA